MKMRKKLIGLVFLLVFIGGTVSLSLAEDYPSRAIDVVLPFAENSLASDGFRELAAAWERKLGHGLRAVYKPGEKRHDFWRDIDSIIDNGYTYAQFRIPEYFLLPLVSKVNYVPSKQQPVVIYQCEPHGLFVRKNSVIKNVDDLMQQLRRDGNVAEIAGQGSGTWGHIAHLKLIDSQELKTVYRAFDKAEQAHQAVRDEEALAYWGRIEEGLYEGIDGLRILAMAAKERHPFFPYVQLLRESGVDLFSANCWGLMLPETTDAEKAKAFSKEIAKITRDNRYRQDVYKLGLDPDFIGYRKVGSHIRNQQRDAKKLLKKYGFVEE